MVELEIQSMYHIVWILVFNIFSIFVLLFLQTTFPEPEDARDFALNQMIRHKDNLIRRNPCPDKAAVDEAFRAALTYMMTKELVYPPQGSEVALRYLRDRINVPRDMGIHSARHLRNALETCAALTGCSRQGPEIPRRHRRDQDPADFRRQ